MLPSSIRSTRRAPTAMRCWASPQSPLSKTLGRGPWRVPAVSETGGHSRIQRPRSRVGCAATLRTTASSMERMVARIAPTQPVPQKTSIFALQCVSVLVPTCLTTGSEVWCAMTQLVTTPLHSRSIARVAISFQSPRSRPIPRVPALTLPTSHPLIRSIAQAASTSLVGRQAAAVTRATTPRWTLPGGSPFSD